MEKNGKLKKNKRKEVVLKKLNIGKGRARTFKGMVRILLLFATIIFAFNIFTSLGKTDVKRVKAEDIRIGTKAKLSVGRFVLVINESEQFDPGEQCYLESGGTIEIIGLTKKKSIIIDYKPPRDFQGSTSCPSGISFLIKSDKFVGLEKIE